MTQSARWLLVTLFAASLSASAGAQNLILNGSFNTDVSSWTPYTGLQSGTIEFSSLDAGGSAASGSAHVTNKSPDDNRNHALSQCRPATAGVSYDLGAKALIPPGQTAGPYYLLVAFA